MAVILKHRKMLATAAWSLSLLAPCMAYGLQPPVPANRPNETLFGDIKMRHYTHWEIDTQSHFDVSGPDIIIESLDPKKPTQFVLHAAGATGHTVKTGKKQTGVAELRGNIRYRITQKTKTGVQVIEGTANHAAYDQAAARLRLTQGVRATITNAAELAGPAPLRTESVTIHTEDGERFDMAGAPDVNDLEFTLRPKPAAKGKAPPQPAAGAHVHLHGFRAGEVLVGHSATVTGAGTMVDFTDPTADGQGTLTASRIVAAFDKTLTRAEARDEVRFHYERRDKHANLQAVTGHADAADYSADQHLLTVTGGVAADLTDAATLTEPAHVLSGRLVAHVLAPFRYTLSGPAERNSLTFRLRPAEKKQATPDAPSTANGARLEAGGLKHFTVGIVHVTEFDTASFEPGKEIVLTGDRTTYRSEDTEAHTASMLRSSRLTALLAEDQTLRQIMAVGNVRFELRQPYPSGKGIRIVGGTATRATLTNAKGEETIQVPGPYQFNSSLEDQTDPFSTLGSAGDALTYNVTTGKISGSSPNGTSTFSGPAPPAAEEKTATGIKTEPAKQRKQ